MTSAVYLPRVVYIDYRPPYRALYITYVYCNQMQAEQRQDLYINMVPLHVQPAFGAALHAYATPLPMMIVGGDGCIKLRRCCGCCTN